MVFHFGCVSGITEAPFAGSGTKHIHQFSGTLTGFGCGSLYSRFGSYQVKFGEFGNVKRAAGAAVGGSQSGAVVGTVRSDFPKSRIILPVYAARVYYPIGSSGQCACGNAAIAVPVVILFNGVSNRTCQHFIRQESQYGIPCGHRQIVCIIHNRACHACLIPIAAKNGGKGSVIARVVGFVGKCSFNYTNGRSHACPRTTAPLRRFAPDRAEGIGTAGSFRTPYVFHLRRYHPRGKVIRSFPVCIAKVNSAVVILACIGMVGKQQDFKVAVVLRQMNIVVRGLQAERTGVGNRLGGYVISLLEIPCGIMPVGVCSRSFGISRDIVRVFQPPCVSQIRL
ncbi:hypothetical protein Barb6_02112 [Bacteroidales bacterium Barb6]|nr:hypothetical protein Barb6_02112 [Bacteroidales bacterium Barb6]